MAIFHCYVSSPEGKLSPSPLLDTNMPSRDATTKASAVAAACKAQGVEPPPQVRNALGVAQNRDNPKFPSGIQC